MAYPMNGNYYYPNQYQQTQIQQPVTQPQMQQQVQQTQMQQPQIQNGGFLTVPNEEVAMNYPVAPGNSVTFKIENAPYICTKTMGFSQLDRPIFERYRLTKEENGEVSQPVEEAKPNPIEEDFSIFKEATKKDIDNLWNEMESLKRQLKRQHNKNKKKDNEED